MYAAIPIVDLNRPLRGEVTPFTDLAFRVAMFSLTSDSTLLPDEMTAYNNSLVAIDFGLMTEAELSSFGSAPFDVSAIAPSNIYDGHPLAQGVAEDVYALALAGLSQQAANRGISTTDWITRLAADAADDGVLNGDALTSALSLGTDIDIFLAGPHSPLATATPMPTETPFTPTFTATSTSTDIPTATDSPTLTPTFTNTPTLTATFTPSNTPVPTNMPTTTNTPAPSATFTNANINTPTATLTNTPTATATSITLNFYLHGSGATANLLTLILNASAPTDATAKYRDSTSINFNGGNLWREIGTWQATPALTVGQLTSLSDLHVWLGLKNSDDQGTRFDLRAEVYKNGVLIVVGESDCITNVTRNEAQAKEVIVPFTPFIPANFNGTTDGLSIKILVRVGTNGAGTFCGGHSNAVGARLYFDALGRLAKFGTP
jgi:hypothetical protein